MLVVRLSNLQSFFPEKHQLVAAMSYTFIKNGTPNTKSYQQIGN